MNNLRPIILCGGSGSRLWPLSRKSLPKQFVPLIDHKSLFDLTLLRCKSITKNSKCRFKIRYEVSGEAFLTKPNKTTYMIQNVIKKITGIKPKLSTSGGTSDARFIRNIAPCLEFGLVGKTMHKIDENVSISDLKKLTKIYQDILVSYFK